MGVYVAIRGWLECDEAQLAAVQEIVSSLADDHYSHGWSTPPQQVNWTHYIFYGADIRESALDWFVSQLREIARIPASDDYGDLWFFTERDDVEEVARLIGEAETEVWLLGTTLGMHIPFLKEAIELSVADGVQFKVLLIERDGAAMTMAHLRAGPRADIEEMRGSLDANLAILSRIARQEAGRIEVRVIDLLAPYTVYAYDPDGRSGRMDLRLGSFHGKHTLRPTFTVEAGRDRDWFVYFYKQFTSMWSVSRPVAL
ncbi:hypothetical protein [Streptomyces sp. NPDC090445]|uniref:hypothetical protein n=1 Tax=Streptomyces sp. NPDC090445 TaxID=3365963 RepID=UPI0038094F06